jgi:hypothetical protein
MGKGALRLTKGSFPLAFPSPSASAYAAHPAKGRIALLFASLHYALNLLPLLRPSLLKTATPREIFPRGVELLDTKRPNAGTVLIKHLHWYLLLV